MKCKSSCEAPESCTELINLQVKPERCITGTGLAEVQVSHFRSENEAKIKSIWLNLCTSLTVFQKCSVNLRDSDMHWNYNRTPTDKCRRVSSTSLVLQHCILLLSHHVSLSYHPASLWGVISLGMCVVLQPGLNCAAFLPVLKNVAVC